MQRMEILLQMSSSKSILEAIKLKDPKFTRQTFKLYVNLSFLCNL